MADSDLNFIQPVEHLHNVQGLTPTRRQEDRKHRQRPPSEQHEPPVQEEDSNKEPAKKDDGSHSIDYCA